MSVAMPLLPAPLTFRNGVPYSETYADVYHSQAGAVAQCRAVFLTGNGLPERWRGRESFQILETGFGLGLNFLTTWHECRRLGSTAPRLHFISLEHAPLSSADLTLALSGYPELAQESRHLLSAWPPLTQGIHRLHFDAGRVTLYLVLGDMADLLPQLTLAADAVYLDGFSPRTNPIPWSEPVLRQVARLCRHGATLATWCVAGHLRRTLEHHGFHTTRAPGFGTKRERLSACYDRIPEDAWCKIVQRLEQPALQFTLEPPPQRHALVIGAGLAGCLVSAALGERGWHIELCESRNEPAQEASGNPAGILRPFPSLDDNRAARLARAGFLTTLHWLANLKGKTEVLPHGLNGVLRIAQDAPEAAHLFALSRAPGSVEALLHWLPRAEAERLGHCAAPWGALFYPTAGWLDPGQFCRAALAQTPHLSTHWGQPVTLQPGPAGWEARTLCGALLAQAPIAILAGGAHPLPLSNAPLWPRQRLRGQITQIERSPVPMGTPVLCGSGYVIPDAPGGPCLGATYDRSADIAPRSADRAENLQRLTALGWDDGPEHSVVQERVAFRSVSRDRLPIIGPVPGAKGLFALTALGSRGLVWAPLGADLLCAWLEGDPLPLEKDLVQAVAPARYR
ncbi:FAD-dependent 5-carboxymethylaminomethyl-2-thiouridine(34) oxidoreductase MnmC [Ferrovum myxofaciens]|uniref:FAD-dependent 5-carboxymethylaminomethyl-2-thiouridine(34) oxidoreductase MnmC n=1 Tax=Ferrovum myxofaciens TaxID=416213 RepID=UPI003EBE8D8D